jgi:hypothetical protein
MRFNPHYELRDKHANLMAPSMISWINYDDDQMDKRIYAAQAARLGDRKHALAAELIVLRVKLPNIQKTINMYVNDAIGYKMQTEQALYYSDNCFGTTDAISFRQDPISSRWMLRIHDLKTGSTRTSMKQLEIYTCIFCLEYNYDPADIDIELRIYKGDDIEIYIPDLDDLLHIIDSIKTFDKRIEEIKKETYGD